MGIVMPPQPRGVAKGITTSSRPREGRHGIAIISATPRTSPRPRGGCRGIVGASMTPLICNPIKLAQRPAVLVLVSVLSSGRNDKFHTYCSA